MHLLLLSNSTNHGLGYLEHALPEVLAFLHGVSEVTFVPYAGGDLDDYTALVRAAFEPHGIAVRGLHEAADPVAAVASAQALFVGCGNTFRLLAALQRLGLIPAIRARVQEGLPYLGANAGATITAPSIRTTNDMPIVQPESFEALGLVPFQINPYYARRRPGRRAPSESREVRLTEFLEENNVPVLGLREGTHLSVTSTRPAPSPSSAVARRTALRPNRRSCSNGAAPPRNLTGDVTALLGHRPVADRPLADAVS